MNKDPKGSVWESPYSTHSRNPIWFSDRLGDTLHGTAEGNAVLQEGLNATLGKQNNAIFYNAQSQTFAVNGNLVKSELSATQLEIVNRYEAVINSSTDNTYIIMVDGNDNGHKELAVKTNGKYGPELKAMSLDDLGVDGQTIQRVLPNGQTAQYSYIARYPKTGPSQNRSVAQDYVKPLTLIHEVAGHAYIKITNPKMALPLENKSVTDFENRARDIYHWWGGNKVTTRSTPHNIEAP